MNFEKFETLDDLIEWGEKHRPRDSQRIRVYRSEWAVSVWRTRRDYLPTVADLQAFTDSVVSQGWFQEHYGWLWGSQSYGQPHITVKGGRDGKTATGDYYRSEIIIPERVRYEEVVLHEICHVITPNIYAWHGPEFCTNLLALVDRWLPEEYVLLKIAMHENKVKYLPYIEMEDDDNIIICKLEGEK